MIAHAGDGAVFPFRPGGGHRDGISVVRGGVSNRTPIFKGARLPVLKRKTALTGTGGIVERLGPVFRVVRRPETPLRNGFQRLRKSPPRLGTGKWSLRKAPRRLGTGKRRLRKAPPRLGTGKRSLRKAPRRLGTGKRSLRKAPRRLGTGKWSLRKALPRLGTGFQVPRKAFPSEGFPLRMSGLRGVRGRSGSECRTGSRLNEGSGRSLFFPVRVRGG